MPKINASIVGLIMEFKLIGNRKPSPFDESFKRLKTSSLSSNPIFARCKRYLWGKALAKGALLNSLPQDDFSWWFASPAVMQEL